MSAVADVLSLLLHMEEQAMRTIEDSAPDVLALQKYRVEELRHMHARAVLASQPSQDQS